MISMDIPAQCGHKTPERPLLLVEDNANDAMLIREQLGWIRPNPYRIRVAERLTAALRARETEEPDVILLDLNLPDSRGLETFRAVREASPNTPIIVLTGLADETLALEALRGGAQDYIVKGSVDGDGLFRALRYATERAGIQAELHASNERFRRLFENVPSGVFRTAIDGRLLTANPALVALLGYADEASLINKDYNDLVHPDSETRAEWLHLMETQGRVSGLETTTTRCDGSEVTLLESAYRLKGSLDAAAFHDGVPIDVEGTLVDITARKVAERQLRELSRCDSLTGLGNRLMFIEDLRRGIARAERQGLSLDLVFFDLDGFKEVNDTLGHDVGDRLLVSIAERLQGAMRASDLVARIGGDEFALRVEGVGDESGLSMIAGNILEVVARPFSIDGHDVSVGASIGIARYPDHGRTCEALLKAGDVAMYRAKQEGGGRARFYSTHLHQDMTEHGEQEAELRRAISAGISSLSGWIECEVARMLPQPNADQLDELHGRIARLERLLGDLLVCGKLGTTAGTPPAPVRKKA